MRKDAYIDTAATLAALYNIEEEEEVAQAIASGSRYRLRDAVLQGEFGDIAARYPQSFTQTNEQPSLAAVTLIAEYFGATFHPAQQCYRSLRVRNNSEQVFSSDGSAPYQLSYWILDETGKQLKEGPRSALPIPLAPGHELTIPVLIETPTEPGRYRLRVMLVQEHVRWLEECPIFETDIHVQENAREDTPPRFVDHDGVFDFNKDIAYCGHLIRKAAALLPIPSDKRIRTVGEIACGSDPQSLRHYIPGTRVIATDVCYTQLQLASLSGRRDPTFKECVQFVCCDAMHIPVREKAFDIVIISAALHHFRDLIKVLLSVRTVLADEGYLLIMREPCKVAPQDPTYIRELRAGFNEQQFELAEYWTIFKRSGFIPVHQEVHFECSYKAILRKAP